MRLHDCEIIDYELADCYDCFNTSCKYIHWRLKTSQGKIAWIFDHPVNITSLTISDREQGCGNCDELTSHRYLRSSCITEGLIDIFRFPRCRLCIDRFDFAMEYFQNKRPLLGELSKLDYVSFEKRNAIIDPKAEALRAAALQFIAVLWTVLPLDARRMVFLVYFEVIFAKYRIGANEFARLP